MYILYLVLVLIFLSILVSIKKQENEVLLEKESTIFVRGLAVLFIMLHHLVQRTVATNSYIFMFNWIGFIMVGIFFLLSGYGNTFSISKNKSINEMFLGLITLTWYIKIQILAYVLLFISYKFFKKNNDIILFFLTLISTIIMILMKLEPYWWNSVLCFAIGCILAEHKNSIINFLKKSNKYIIIPLSIVTFLALFYLGSIVEELKIIANISFCMLIVILLYYYKFSSKIINFLGNLSLEIYLWHMNLIILLFEDIS